MRIPLVLVALFLSAAPFLNANAGTAFKAGEETSGMTKTCYYDYLGSTYTKTVSSVTLCPLSINVSSPPSSVSPESSSPGYSSGTAFKTGENTRGMTKTCFYDYLGSQYTKTVSSVALCPLTIKVKN